MACCILDGGKDTLTQCLEVRLVAESFFKPAHRMLFEVLVDLYQEGKEVDDIILSDALESRTLGTLKGRERDPEKDRVLFEVIGGWPFLNRLTGRIESLGHAKYWLEIVREKWLLRRMIATSQSVIEDCFAVRGGLDEFIERVEQQVFSIGQDRVTDSARPLRESIDATTQLISRLLQGQADLDGVQTGFTDLDNMTFGFHPGEMIVLAARPSMGKTSLALNMAEHAVLPPRTKPVPTLFFSLEMGADQLAMRLLCGRAKVDAKMVRDRKLSKEGSRALNDAAKEMKAAPMWIDDAGYLGILEMRAKARRFASRQKIGFIVIDYLQLISGSDPRVPREQQISEISRGVKAMAKELNVPVLILSQLNRDSEREKRDPRLSDLRESGSIEQDADVVLLLARERSNESDGGNQPTGVAGPVKLKVAKQRNGPVGDITLMFTPHFTRFDNFTRQTV